MKVATAVRTNALRRLLLITAIPETTNQPVVVDAAAADKDKPYMKDTGLRINVNRYLLVCNIRNKPIPDHN